MSSDSNSPRSELEHLQAEGIRVLREERPARPPVLSFLKPVVDWFERRLIEILRETGVPAARPAFNPVFIHLPADGCRLTELAAKADMTKQAMSEIVDELIALGYLARFPDPRDGRAKLILRSQKGLELHGKAMAAFAQIDRELVEMIGPATMDRLRAAAEPAAEAVRDS